MKLQRDSGFYDMLNSLTFWEPSLLSFVLKLKEKKICHVKCHIDYCQQKVTENEKMQKEVFLELLLID
jgi:hypothetical protein